VRIEWSVEAGHDLREVHASLAQDNKTAAARVIRAIREGVQALSANPLLGRVGGVAGTRELVLSRYPYLVVYRVRKLGVRVLAVIHTSRHWQVDFSRE
jgi:toxin ParE1/3/4